MKTRMMWMGTLAALLSLTGCQQRDGEVRMQNRDNQAQQGAQDTKGESGTGGMIPESGVREHTIGGIGGGQQADEPQGDGSMARDAEDDQQLQQQTPQSGDQDSNR